MDLSSAYRSRDLVLDRPFFNWAVSTHALTCAYDKCGKDVRDGSIILVENHGPLVYCTPECALAVSNEQNRRITARKMMFAYLGF